MPLNLLLDENISQVVSAAVLKNRPTIVIESVHRWKEGVHRGQTDWDLLIACADAQMTLVTYDLRTVPILLAEVAACGQSHGGVILIYQLTISNNDFGLLVRALIRYWDRYKALDWMDRVAFLDKPA